MKAIIVDDEPKAIELLKVYLQHFDYIELVHTFRNSLRALEFLNNNDIELVFLDVNMPYMSGIQLANALNGANKIIFTTAYTEFAAESYNMEAVDYLVKPITFERFAASMGKLARYISTNNLETKPIFLKSGSKTIRVKPSEILFLEKDGNYMNYHLSNSKIMVRQSIAEAICGLPDYFFQVHKSYIVNARQISSFNREVLTIAGVEVPIGQSFKESVRMNLNAKKNIV